MKGDSTELIINDGLTVGMWPHNELTARQYAAIHLLQPTSGLDWLDDMIRARMMDEIAKQVIVSLRPYGGNITPKWAAEWAYQVADAIMKQREADR